MPDRTLANPSFVRAASVNTGTVPSKTVKLNVEDNSLCESRFCDRGVRQPCVRERNVGES